MNKTLHQLLLNTHLAFHKKVFGMLNDTGLTSGQPKILDYLSYNDGCVQKDIAAACEIETSTVTSLLLRMEEAGLIERHMLNGNRRSLYVFLTDKGKLAQNKVGSVFLKLEKVAFDGFTEEEQKDFLEKLSKMHKNLTNENK